MIVSASHNFQRPAVSIPTNRRRSLERYRIQKLKTWHENVKKIARSEIDFINSIFNEEHKDRDWLRDSEDDENPEDADGQMVKKDA